MRHPRCRGLGATTAYEHMICVQVYSVYTCRHVLHGCPPWPCPALTGPDCPQQENNLFITVVVSCFHCYLSLLVIFTCHGLSPHLLPTILLLPWTWLLYFASFSSIISTISLHLQSSVYQREIWFIANSSLAHPLNLRHGATGCRPITTDST